ncbi:tetratricopeptide repeat protein [Verrucomicrobiota bacterium]
MPYNILQTLENKGDAVIWTGLSGEQNEKHLKTLRLQRECNFKFYMKNDHTYHSIKFSQNPFRFVHAIFGPRESILMRGWHFVSFCCVLACAGCATFKTEVTAPNLAEPALSDSDTALVKSLAHYVHSMLLEDNHGLYSNASLEQIEKAIELNPSELRLYIRAANIYVRQNRLDDTIKLLEKACENNPDNVLAHEYLAGAYNITSQHDKALRKYRKAAKLAPEKYSLYLNQGKILLSQKKNRDALRILSKGLKSSNNSAALLPFCYKTGADLLKKKKKEEAQSWLDLVISHDQTGSMRFRQHISLLYESLGYEKEAIQYLSLATEAEKPEASAFNALAGIYLKKDMIEKAKEILKTAGDKFPDDLSILFTRGQLYNYEKEFDKAIIVFQKAEKVAEKNPETRLSPFFYLEHGGAYERIGQHEKAEVIFKKCIELYPNCHPVLNYLAYMWAEQEVKLEQGLKHITKALEYEPENGAYIDTLGWIYYKQKKYEDALVQIQKANKLINHDPAIIDHLGDVFNALNDKKQAILYWKQSLLLEPENKTVAQKLKKHGIDTDKILKESKNKKKPADNTRKNNNPRN